MPDARSLPHLFTELADLIEIEGTGAHRASAYRRAAVAVRDWPEDLAVTAAQGRLRSIPGIGPVLAEKITAYLATGRIEALDRLREAVPPGVVAMLAVHGVGCKLVAAAWHTLGLRGVDELRAACADGRLATLPGVGPARARRILQAMDAAAARGLLLPDAAAWGEAIASALQDRAGVAATIVAAETRRGCPLVPRLHLLAAGDPAAAAAAFAVAVDWRRAPEPVEPGNPGEPAAALPWPSWRAAADPPGGGPPVDCLLTVCPPETFGTALLLTTGSPAHLAEIAAWRQARGEDQGWPPLRADEADAYAALGLPWIPPELREGAGEVAAAAAGRLFPDGGRLVEASDLRGDLHCHTRYSDGRHSVAEMAAAAAARGYRYLAVADHSASLVIAHGLTTDRLRAQRAEIDAYNAAAGGGCVVLQGAEVEILRDGALDYPEAALASLDFCVASLHNAYGQGEAELTARLLRALAHPAVDVIGHPTGRRLLRREAQPVDHARLAAEAALRGKALEVNGSPDRLDLDGSLGAAALRAGVAWFALDSDAHAAPDLANARWAAVTARRAGIGPGQVLNALDRAELLRWRGRGA